MEADMEHDSLRITLEDSVTIAQAFELKLELQNALAEAKPVIVELTALDRIDTAVMQLLLVFARAAKVDGIPVEWKGSSKVFGRALDLLGIREEFDVQDA